MNTFIHILKSINWIDVTMLVLLVRIVFIGVKTGFVTELFKLLGIFCAALVGLNYYTPWAAFIAQKTHSPLNICDFVLFVTLVCLVVLIVKYLRDGFLALFKFETTHAGIDQWGSALLSVVRALFIISVVLYACLLTNAEYLQRLTFTSISHKVALRIAPNTYKFTYDHVIGRLFEKAKFNEEVMIVIRGGRK